MTTKQFPSKDPLATVTVQDGIYVLSMHNLPDNRLTPNFVTTAMIPALNWVELDFYKAYKNGDREAALVLTGERAKGKFFSNGLDLSAAAVTPGFFKNMYYKLMSQLMTMPMPTVAAINGHCFAGGFALALCCDWRIIRAERAWCCMNEIDFGAPLPRGMAAVLADRMTGEQFRKTMFTGHRWTAAEGVKEGFLHESVNGDSEAVIARSIEFAQAQKKHSASGCMQMMKQTLSKDALIGLQIDDQMNGPTPSDNAEVRFRELVAAETQAKL